MSRAEAQRRGERKTTKGEMRMGKMGYGYGSEFHLLRWMGRHRDKFNEEVRKAIGVKGGKIEWFDFEFESKNFIPDSELKGLDFLKGDKRGNAVLSAFEDGEQSWPQTGQVMNWDAVGRIGDEYILCEAKAHVEEIEKVHKVKESKSVPQRLKAFKFAQNEKRVNASVRAEDWMLNYYQMANRLYVLALLHEHHVKAYLLNIYFCGDCHRGWNCPETEGQWRDNVIKDEMEKLGIVNSDFVKKWVKHLFLPIA